MNDINVIKENYDTRFPKTNKQFVDSLDEEAKKLYINLYYAYSVLFNDYINNLLNLKEYDNELKDLDPVKEEKMDIYQYLFKDSLKYIYIRNNIYIERLSVKEKEFLMKCVSDADKMPSVDAYNFIEKTYKKVIFENINNNGSICATNFGPLTQRYIFPNNSLILGIRYEQYANPSVPDEEFKNKYISDLFKVTDISKKMSNELKEKLDIPVFVTIYDDYSVEMIKKNDFYPKVK